MSPVHERLNPFERKFYENIRGTRDADQILRLDDALRAVWKESDEQTLESAHHLACAQNYLKERDQARTDLAIAISQRTDLERYAEKIMRDQNETRAELLGLRAACAEVPVTLLQSADLLEEQDIDDECPAVRRMARTLEAALARPEPDWLQDLRAREEELRADKFKYLRMLEERVGREELLVTAIQQALENMNNSYMSLARSGLEYSLKKLNPFVPGETST